MNISQSLDDKNYQNSYDTINKILTQKLNDQKTQALSLAVSLEKNTHIKTALLNENEDLGYEILSQNVYALKKHLKWDNIYTQILTQDLFVFARSWDSTFSGMPLENYREDLKEVAKTQQPKVEISIGRLLSIKASVPIHHDDETIGTLEVISLLDNLVSNLRKYRIELIPLMDLDFINQAYFMDNNPVVSDKFIVVNKNFNHNLLKILQELNKGQIEELLENDYLAYKDKIFLRYPMVNRKGDLLGIFVAIVSKENISNYFGDNNSIIQRILTLNATQDNVYNFIKYKNDNVFMNINDGYIANFNIILDEKEKIEFEEVARSRLSQLTKKELIDFILNKSKQVKITGEIK
jgi:hypothetical protein